MRKGTRFVELAKWDPCCQEYHILQTQTVSAGILLDSLALRLEPLYILAYENFV